MDLLKTNFSGRSLLIEVLSFCINRVINYWTGRIGFVPARPDGANTKLSWWKVFRCNTRCNPTRFRTIGLRSLDDPSPVYSCSHPDILRTWRTKIYPRWRCRMSTAISRISILSFAMLIKVELILYTEESHKRPIVSLFVLWSKRIWKKEKTGSKRSN